MATAACPALRPATQPGKGWQYVRSLKEGSLASHLLPLHGPAQPLLRCGSWFLWLQFLSGSPLHFGLCYFCDFRQFGIISDFLVTCLSHLSVYLFSFGVWDHTWWHLGLPVALCSGLSQRCSVGVMCSRGIKASLLHAEPVPHLFGISLTLPFHPLNVTFHSNGLI